MLMICSLTSQRIARKTYNVAQGCDHKSANKRKLAQPIPNRLD
jgi:hypothetical protein